MKPVKNNERELDGAIRALRKLSPRSRDAVGTVIRQLAEKEDVATTTEYLLAVDGIPPWVAKLRARCSERTIGIYTFLARQFLREHPDPTRLEIQQHLARRLEDGVSTNAVENTRKALASLFKFLYEEGLRPTNPMAGVEPIRTPRKERWCPSPEDVKRVVDIGYARAADAAKMRTITLLIATTGLRLGEAVSILKENIDLGRGEIRVMGKGRKERVVFLVPETAEVLAKYMEERGGGSPFLFPGKTKTGHCEVSNVEKTLKRACLRAGVRPFTPHQLRHFFATEALRDGAKLEVISKTLGHAGVGITGDIYRHIRAEEVREEMLRHTPLNGMGLGSQREKP